MECWVRKNPKPMSPLLQHSEFRGAPMCDKADDGVGLRTECIKSGLRASEDERRAEKLD